MWLRQFHYFGHKLNTEPVTANQCYLFHLLPHLVDGGVLVRLRLLLQLLHHHLQLPGLLDQAVGHLQ